MSGYEVRIINEQKGKGLFATKHFSKGDVILEECPIVSCQFAWNEGFKYEACDYCMRPLETAQQNVRRLSVKPELVLPYPECCEAPSQVVACAQCHVLYCSEECRERAYHAYHRTLCHNRSDASHPLVQLQETWKQMHFPPETTSVMLVMRLLALVQQSPSPPLTRALLTQFCHRTVSEDARLVHKLLGEKFLSQIALLREMAERAIQGEHLQEFLTMDGFISLMALIGTNGQGIGTSPLATWVNNTSRLPLTPDQRKELDHLIDQIYEYIEEESGSFLNAEGSGLYEIQSACNHSCEPNAQASFPYSCHRLQLKALEDIPVGGEILISYLEDCQLARSRHSRHKELEANYLFTCSCTRCQQQAHEPDVTSEEEEESEGDVEDMAD